MSVGVVSKLIFLLLTWPLGVLAVSSFIMAGGTFPLAVHEIVFLVVLCVLMVDATIYLFSKAGSSSPTSRTIWYGIRVSLGAFLSFLLSPIPRYLNGSGSERFAGFCGIVLLLTIVIVGVVSAYKYITSSNPVVNMS